MIEIDGSIGGGSVLRIAVPFAIANQDQTKIYNIRKTRSSPGLKNQHLKGIELLAQLTNSSIKGTKIGSTEIIIEPNEEYVEKAKLKIPTAGSIPLIYQMLSNYVALTRNKIDVEFIGGGTHTKWSPTLDYLENVTIKAMRLFGQNTKFQTKKMGYYPKGGAEGRIMISQDNITPKIELDIIEDRDFRPDVISRASEHLKKAKVAERQLQGILDQIIRINSKQIIYDQTDSIGTSITVNYTEPGKMYQGYSQLGQKGVPAEKIGQDLALRIKENTSPAAVDEFLADQLMVPLSKAKSGSFYTIPKLTKHVTTNIELINYLTENSLNLQYHDDYYIVSKI